MAGGVLCMHNIVLTDFFEHEWRIPSRKLTYPTCGKGKSSSNMPYQEDMLIPWRVFSTLKNLT